MQKMMARKHDDAYYRDFYPGVDQAIVELKQGNVAFVEPIISYLEKDPYTFGSGYRKEKIWRFLRRVSLTEKQKERLRAVALKQVWTRMSREFFPMCRFISAIADGKFREQLERVSMAAGDADVLRRAALLDAYCVSLHNGERYRWQSLRSWSRYIP